MDIGILWGLAFLAAGFALIAFNEPLAERSWTNRTYDSSSSTYLPDDEVTAADIDSDDPITARFAQDAVRRDRGIASMVKAKPRLTALYRLTYVLIGVTLIARAIIGPAGLWAALRLWLG